MLGMLMSNGDGIKSMLSRRYIIWGGPLIASTCKNPEVLVETIIQKLLEVITKQCIYIEIRNQSDMNWSKPVFIRMGFVFHDHLNYLITLDEETPAKINKSKIRQIKKSLENGAKIKVADLMEEVEAFTEILFNLYRKKINKPLPHMSFFTSFFEKRELGVILIIQKNGKVLGGMICPLYKGTIYEWYVASESQVEDGIYPGVLTTWAAIHFGREHGLKVFDFMGAGNPKTEYGVRQFKSQFGGTQVNFGRFIRINKPVLFLLGSMGLKLSRIIYR